MSELPGPSIIKCASWQNFKSPALQNLFEQKPFHRGRFLFRGHGSSEWPLKSGFDRWFQGERSKKSTASERLIQLFQQEAEGIDIEREIWNDRERRLALAQHHGVPTRLLDWTESPYVAAFFAFANVESTNPNGSAGIWCLDRSQRNVWASGSGVEILHVPSYSNERIRNQLGWFTLLSAPYDTLEEYVRHFDDAGKALRQYQVPCAEARRALADLDLMGVNYSRIYPGLEGCARTAQLRARWEG
ncbi:FRG domain-containing protein [Bradyrhizobium yuanmingense]|uniref:FRG domain-containing protein n=1 Tax=Bradyrhizobium yuanmingense TaxID=108015 RepID=UPI0009E7152B|nr:FRG domain-containing protein [Bradyrhizobium yuanmingense]